MPVIASAATCPPNPPLVPRTQRSASWRCAAEPGPMPHRSPERWVPALRSSGRTLQRIRDTRVSRALLRSHRFSPVHPAA